MSNTATQDYDVTLAGPFSSAQVQAALAAVPLPLVLFAQLGLVLNSDVVVGGPPVERQVQWFLTVQGIPNVTSAVAGNADTISSVAFVSRGLGFAEPPIITAALPAVPVQQDSLATPVVKQRPAKFTSTLRVNSTNVVTQGSGYGASATVVAVGGLKSGGVAATFTATVLAGAVTAVTMVTPGSGYIGMPLLVITGASPGTGAVAIPLMELEAVNIIDGGAGFVPGSTPVLTITPGFQYRYPDNTKFNFRNLLTNLFRDALATPVFAKPTQFA